MNWYEVRSTECPAETDKTMSKKYNYVRRNIREEEVEQDGEIITVYVYEEAKVNKEDWGLYLDSIQSRADIDYIALMTDVEL